MKTKIIKYLEQNRDNLPLIIFCGPTASGKSALAIECAKECNGEIISIDSMQIYKSLEIGTAQPSFEEQKEIKHHLIGCFDIHQRVDVTKFVKMAEDAIIDIRSRGKNPILAGGTGLYLRTLLYGMDDLPASVELRKELDAKYDSKEGYLPLCEKMKSFDPLAFEKFKDCQRRLIRAMEVKILSGKSLVELQSSIVRKCRYDIKCFKLEGTTEVLRERIYKRTKIMLSSGWLEEAQNAINNGLFSTPTAHQALGYKLINEYLNNQYDLQTLTENIATATWQFARRQRTWFKNQNPQGESIEIL